MLAVIARAESEKRGIAVDAGLHFQKHGSSFNIVVECLIRM